MNPDRHQSDPAAPLVELAAERLGRAHEQPHEHLTRIHHLTTDGRALRPPGRASLVAAYDGCSDLGVVADRRVNSGGVVAWRCWRAWVRLPPEEWYASLPAFLASSTAIITDPAGALLPVKSKYRDHWNLPGGILAADEPPDVCCRREVAEELGLAVKLGRLLVVDWVAPTAIRRAWFGFMFNGGTLTHRSRVRLQGDELDAYEFVAVPDP